MTTNIFISYSRKNKDFAIQIVSALKLADCEVWIDIDEIPPSAEWWSSIKQGIDEADSFVVILTPESLSSPVCTFEMDYAIKNNKRIIPLMRNEAVKSQTLGNIASVEPTGFLAEILGSADLLDIARDNWRTVEKLNWINVRETDNFDDNIKKLLAVVAEDPQFVQQHTRLLIRAREWNDNGRKAAYALHGEDLHDAEIWLAASGGKQPVPTELHNAYIIASQQVRKDEQNRNRALTQARFGILLAIALLAILGFVFVNLRNGEQSSANSTLAAQSILANNNLLTAVAAQATSARQADESQSLSWVANANERYAAGDLFTALSLAIEANRIPNPPSSAQQLLVDLAYAPGVIRQFKTLNPFVRIFSVAWNKDSQTFITAGTNRHLYLWDKEQEQPIRQFKVDDSDISSTHVIWNSDGQFFVTVGNDGEILLWDKEQEQPIRHFKRDDSSVYIRKVIWNGDNQTFVTVDTKGEILLWDKEQEQPIRHFKRDNSDISVNSESSNNTTPVILSHFPDFVQDAAWNKDGQFFVTVGTKGEILLWDKEQEQPIRRFTEPNFHDNINSVVWNSDGQFFVTVDSSDQVFLWDKDREQFIRHFQKDALNSSGNVTGSNSTAPVVPAVSAPPVAAIGGGSSLKSAVWNSDGQLFLTVDNSAGGIILWDKDQERPLRRFNGEFSDLLAIAWNNDGQSFTTIGYGGEVILWNTDRGRSTYQFKGNLRNINDVAWSADSNSFLTVGDDGQVFLWDQNPKQPIRQFRAPDDEQIMSKTFAGVVWNSDGQSFLTAGDGILLWNKGQERPIRRFEGFESSGVVRSIAWNGDNQTFVTVGGNGEVFLWDKDREQPIRQFMGHSLNRSVGAVAWNRDDQTFVTIGDNEEVFLWDKDQEQPIRQFKGLKPDYSAYNIAWSKNGQSFVTVGYSGDVYLWDKDQDYPIRQFLGHNPDPGVDGYVSSVVWNPSDQTFVTAGSGGEVFLWNPNQERPIRQFKGHDPESFISDVAWNQDGQHFVTVGSHGEVFLWDKDQDRPIRQFKGNKLDSSLESVTWSSDGQLFVTIGDNSDVLIWDKNFDQPIRQFKGRDNAFGGIRKVAWNSDGKFLVTVSESGDVFLWQVEALDELIQWILDNRFVPKFSCSQRVLYAVPPFCDEQGTPPVLTPYLTWTPSPTASLTPTADLNLTTATATLSITPTIPTWTPTLTWTPSATSNIATQRVQAATDVVRETAQANSAAG